MDPAKLKVVELRAELSQRGLDAKGNKAVLVERLRKALEEETGNHPVDTTITETDTEDTGDSLKETREKSPEPSKTVPTPKTPVRGARSSTATTPVKTPSRAAAKTPSTPVSAKQPSPVKTPTQEKPQEIEPTSAESVIEKPKEVEDPQLSPVPAETSEQEPESSLKSVEADILPASPQNVSHNEESTEKSDANVDRESPVKSTDHVKDISDLPDIVEDTGEQKSEMVEELQEVVQESSESSAESSVKGEQDDKDIKSEPIQEEEHSSLMEEASIQVKAEERMEEDVPSSTEVTKAESDDIIKKEVTEEPVEELPKKIEGESSVKREEDVEMKEQTERESEVKDRDRKDRKDRKRKRSPSPREERHITPPLIRAEDEPEFDEDAVLLSWYDSDLNLMINKDSFCSATPMHSDGFCYIWAGARASYGFTCGKVYYETKIIEHCPINLQDEENSHVLRVGWSVAQTSMQLGEEKLSYGYGGTGKKSTNNKFTDYGGTFTKDDVVGCFLDMSNDENVIISYTLNGENLGEAFTISKAELGEKALFPHVLSKNCSFACNFGQEESWIKGIPVEYVPVGTVELKDRTPGPRRPSKKQDCEMIMMCGLPAAGKTFWANKYAVEHADKMYNILSTNNLIDKMKVLGLPRKRNYHGRWEVLIDKCTRALNKLLDVASIRRRNYILDQTNVYPSAQRRKMRHFYGFHRRAVVVVPTDEEFKLRTAKREAIEGKDVPDTAVLEMKANFSSPSTGESFDVVEWSDLPEDEAKKIIEKYNKEGRDAGFGQQQVNKKPRFERSDSHRDSRDSRNSRDSRDSRDHRDRRGYPDRNRNSGWRGGSNSGWRDRQQRGGHMRHGGGYGGPPSGGWRGGGRGGPSATPSSSHRGGERRGSGGDRRPGNDRNRQAVSRQGNWAPMGSYQSSQPQQGHWSQPGSSWSSGSGGQSQQQNNWSGQQSGWGQQSSWGNWKGYGQGSYNQSGYGQQGYGNGNWNNWNSQYYNQYWGQQQQQQQQSGQTTTAGGQAVSKQ
ncbi:heterogeneous nuclear ribonucleoprotein U-like protein 2 isoform X2 [Cephus cinctus]|uniref:Heterogeneous nuclear ribonucleoprotein U-like protein 2 isoform X2 n=1 Tax=Cephus cinctus TaxID=211228 RepID=A0AAJ7CA25_CEPCN|nr:heterogeneous nuclear ribonucleoprotein U-like protein 2 isoform X2 [Cephus cinctus]